MHKVIRNVGLGVFLLAYSLVSNSATLIVNNGILMGATDVDVDGGLYDVLFLDGTCIELYDGCDESTDFPFTNPANLNDSVLLRAAMQALLDQVFIDSPSGAFDTQPALMNGCDVVGGCNIATPLFVNGAGNLGVAVTFNWTPEHRDVISVGSGGSNTGDTSPVPGFDDMRAYAVWNGASAVPVPSAIWLFGSALLGLVGISKKQKHISLTIGRRLAMR